MLTNKESIIIQLFNEVHTLDNLTHDYIISIEDYYKTRENKLILILEYCEMGDLSKQIHDQRATLFEERRLRKWFVQIVLALHHAHSYDILHRDIKPANIYLTQTDDVRLADFGLSTKLGMLKGERQETLGTPIYTPPEFLAFRSYNKKSDMWQLGALLYELMALKPAFFDLSTANLNHKILNQDTYPLPDHFSKEFRSLVNSLLNKNPNSRPSTAEILNSPLFSEELSLYNNSNRQCSLSHHSISFSKSIILSKINCLKVMRHSEYRGESAIIEKINYNNKNRKEESFLINNRQQNIPYKKSRFNNRFTNNNEVDFLSDSEEDSAGIPKNHINRNITIIAGSTINKNSLISPLNVNDEILQLSINLFLIEMIHNDFNNNSCTFIKRFKDKFNEFRRYPNKKIHFAFSKAINELHVQRYKNTNDL